MRQPPSQNPAPQEGLAGHAQGHVLSRRAVLAGLPLMLAGCVSADYGAVSDGGFVTAPIDMTTVDPSLLRQEVAWPGKEKPGSIVVNVPERRLYLVEAGGKAMRYGVGVGRTEGTNFRGQAIIGRKEKWPHWTPTANMIAAMPRYKPYAGGLEGGPDNPLGARARSISIATATTRFSVCTAPPSRRPSATRSPRAASVCSIRTSSISITACRSAPM